MDNVAAAAQAVEQSFLEGDAQLLGMAKQLESKWTAGELKINMFGKEGLRVIAFAEEIMERVPAAVRIEGENTRLLFDVGRKGVYRRGSGVLLAAAVELLGDRFRPSHVAAVEAAIVGLCVARGRLVRDFGEGGWVNCANGWLHVASGQWCDHAQGEANGWYSDVQLGVAWNPDATCEYYERWCADIVGEDQLEALEEASSAFFTPRQDLVAAMKTLFLFGPPRSGKSTWLSLMRAIAGGSYSSMTLHQLAGSRFMRAELQGKLLNVGGDLSARHVDDLSVWKMLTGEDAIEAERKNGHPFTFVNQAAMAFSANEVPTVSDGSGAYVARMSPFEFSRSFLGKESPAAGRRLVGELEGIFVRWVAAARRMAERGSWPKSLDSVAAKFRVASDRVDSWVAECCTVHGYEEDVDGAMRFVAPRAGECVELGTSGRMLFREFMAYCREGNSRSSMRERSFRERLERAADLGIVPVRFGPNYTRGWNLTVHESYINGVSRVQGSGSGLETGEGSPG